jgi:hypothetical protein
VFSTIYQTATLIVPTGCLDAYRQTAAWNEFVNIEEADLNVNIEFADATVKALCVQNWDTDGDGELSYDEAAAVTDLGLVFSGHDQVTSFDELQYFTGLTSLGELAFGGCNYLASITFPASVTTIGTNAFNNCFTLESVTIPASVTSIAEYAFFSCGGLQAVISLIQDPFEIGDDVFLETPRDQGLAVLYVPAGCKAKYEATNGWKSFQNIVEMGGSDDPDEVAQKKEQLQKTIYSLMAKLQALFNELEEKPDCEEKTEAQQRAYIVGAEIDTAQKNLSTASSLDELSAVEKETNNLMAALAYLYQIIQEIPDTEAVVFVVDGITYMVISEEEKTVQVGQGNWDYRAVDKTTEGEITIPAQVEGYNVVAISDFAFEGCSRLTKINIPEGVISIGEQGFCRCSSLKSIHIPASLTSIGYVAFSSCGNVETITVAEGNTRYSSPDGCNAIIQSGYCLVRGCRNTVIPEGVTAMNNCAFNGVSGLTTITLPQSLTSVGGWAFSGCTDLQNVVLSENTSSIGYMAFNGCSSLTSITLPGQVNIIREYAFAGCNSLMNIIVKMEAPFAITDDVFQCWIDNNNLYLYDNATLYVPKGTKALYGSTDGWKNFQNIVEMDYDDMTYLLSNPQFEDGKNGWIVQAAGGGNVAVAGLPENKCFEAWNNSSFDIYQVVTGAPVGVYEIEVQGFYRYLRGDNAWNAYKDQQVDYVKPEGVPVYVYLNNNATPFKNIYSEPVPYGTLYTTNSSLLYPSNLPPCEDDMGNWYPNEMYNSAIAFNAGMYKQSAFGLIAKEGDPFRIGVKGKSNQGNDSWVIWDNFKLFYRGFKPDVVRPILETAIADVEEYLGLLMGKTEYAALTTGLANAVQGIADNDGELMFSALNMLWDVKDPARISKDIFLEQEVAADTLRLAEKLRSLANEHLSKATFNDACALLEGIKNNTLYENTETALLKNDVTAMINRLQASVTGYDKLLSAYDEIYKTDARVGDDTRAGLADEFKEIEYLADLGYQNYYDGTFTDEQAYDYTNDLLRRVEILKENIANYIVPADWAILKTAYEQNNPNGTWSKIWKFNRGKPWKDDVPGVETDDGHVVSLWLTDNNMTGAVPMDFFTLPNLHTVNLSSNHLTTLDEALPAQVTYLYLDDQTMDYVANISLKDAVTNGVAQQMPSILRYDHSSRSFTAPLTLYCSTTDNKWSMHIEVGSEGQMSITYASDAYIGANGAMFNASTWDGSTFSVCLTFEQGDGNFDGEVNVLDLQADINYIFENRSKPFNLTAADLFTDSKVTVQDIVKLVDVLMAAGGDNPTAGARNVAPARVSANVQSCLFVQNGQLMLSTDTPVAAFDIFVDQTFDFTLDEALRQMGFKCRMEQQQSGYHLIGYSLAGATLPVGETVIGTTTGRDAVVTSALLSDADAQPVSVMLNDQITTAIGHASDLRPQTSALYDLQGRRLDKVGRKGMYIKDNRKIVK